MPKPNAQETETLRRDIGLNGAVLMGLGSIVGTGVFVSIGVASGVAGPNVLIATFLAALLATCNGLSSAQLAASHPVSGGTYEYGYRWLRPGIGFAAGWLFLCAKSASAATALLGLAGYLSSTFEHEFNGGMLLISILILGLITGITLAGIKRSNLANSLIVALTLIALLSFVLFGFSSAVDRAPENLNGIFTVGGSDTFNLFHATALMFVAYTGYGRIATLGEEVKRPKETIPRAMIATLFITMALYTAVGFVAVALVGADALSLSTKTSIAPLLFAANSLDVPWVRSVLFLGAMTAMLGVVLNLLLGLSRVALAMARRNDLPPALSVLASNGTPKRATIFVALIIGALVLLGDVRLSWSFSAFTVLLYYSITNLCAIRLEADSRLYPVWIPWCGLTGCISLACWITPAVAAAGLIILAIGYGIRGLCKASMKVKTTK